jgi:hypothetical protein
MGKAPFVPKKVQNFRYSAGLIKKIHANSFEHELSLPKCPDNATKWFLLDLGILPEVTIVPESPICMRVKNNFPT